LDVDERDEDYGAGDLRGVESGESFSMAMMEVYSVP